MMYEAFVNVFKVISNKDFQKFILKTRKLYFFSVSITKWSYLMENDDR